ncbi:MAG: choice-of-anchor D domain-containing protein [Actinomycetota bacterium]
MSISTALSPSGANPVTGSLWTEIGPQPLTTSTGDQWAGAVLDVAIDPRGSADKVIYRATAGGVWKSTDAGVTWAPKTDSMPALPVGAVALDPTNPSIVYAGTGTSFVSHTLLPDPAGIYRSADGGETWTVVSGSSALVNDSIAASVDRIVVPSSGVVLAATDEGLFRSIDGGEHFGNDGPSFSNGEPVLDGYVTDLHLDTQTPSTVFAAQEGGGLWKSTDAGATFSTNLFTTATGAPDPSTYGYMSFGQSTTVGGMSSGNTMFLSLSTTCEGSGVGCDIAGLYKSTDGGASWVSTSGIFATNDSLNEGTTCQCNYDNKVAVDPLDAKRVYFSDQKVFVSTDGGATFDPTDYSGSTHPHFDVHAFTFRPSTHPSSGSISTFWLGSDGGLWSSDDGGSSWTSANGGVATNQMLSIDIGRGSSANSAYTYGGMWDVGFAVHPHSGQTGPEWYDGLNADGVAVGVDAGTPTTAYAATGADYTFRMTSDGGTTWQESTDGVGAGLPAVVTLVAVDPAIAGRVYAAAGYTDADGNNQSNSLYVSTDSGSTFTKVHTFDIPSGVTTLGIRAIAVSPVDSDTVWVALNDGELTFTSDALVGSGSHWTSVTPPSGVITNQPVRAIAIDPTNSDRVAIGYGGLSKNPSTQPGQHVFLSSDAGAAWTDISGTNGGPSSLPNLPVNSIVIDAGTTPHSIIVADQGGVVRTADGGASWQRFGVGLPIIDSTQLALDSSVSPPVLRVATYGRSVYELASPTGPLLAVNGDLAFDRVPVGRRATRVVQLFNVGSADLHILSFSRSAGSNEFSVISGPSTPVTIPPGEELDWTVQFAPTSAGDETAVFTVQSDDPTQPTYDIPASGTGVAGIVELSGDLDFGTVARGTTTTRAVAIQNVGEGYLHVTKWRMAGSDCPSCPGGRSFSTDEASPTSSAPLEIAPGEQVTIHVRFSPPADSDDHLREADLHVASDDPDDPDATLHASGRAGVPVTGVSTASLNFGGVPVDGRTDPHFRDKIVTFYNQASCSGCDAHITGVSIAPSSGTSPDDFELVDPPGPGSTVGAGNHLDITVRFDPTNLDDRSATLTITSDDPATPTRTVSLTGRGLVPGIATPNGNVLASATDGGNALIFPPTVIDPVCSPVCGRMLSEPYTNSGQAELIVDGVAFSGSSAFSGPGATSPPQRYAPNGGGSEAVMFDPTTVDRRITGQVTFTDNLGTGHEPLDASPITRTVAFCGEGAGRGIRVLAQDANGSPFTQLKSLKLVSHGFHSNVNLNMKNLSRVSLSPPTTCLPVMYQYENQNLPNTDRAGNQGAYYDLTVTVGNQSKTLSFSLAVNEFKTIVMTIP